MSRTPTGGLSTGELERRTGFAASTLRYYERVGLLPPPHRVNGRRRYEPTTVERLGAIRLCVDAGFTLDEIRLMLGDTRRPRRTWRELAERKIEELTARIADAETARDLLVHALDCPAPDIVACPHYRAHVAERTDAEAVTRARRRAAPRRRTNGR